MLGSCDPYIRSVRYKDTTALIRRHDTRVSARLPSACVVGDCILPYWKEDQTTACKTCAHPGGRPAARELTPETSNIENNEAKR
ncbi:hypothetical protein GDO81_020830 [Engystomops pustulosus]|uniref:Zona pellucida glycoprotein 3 n=1 Tax=Engystomops pustulosus TaxID=76066 RepID=A0AAV6Z0I6_ENGPU|nr:hypothetical protein GDO81_020830 [Engystomops pustulosus]